MEMLSFGNACNCAVKPKDDDDDFSCSARFGEPVATGQDEARPTSHDRR
jgi:hypothetical protein